ncbi:MAG: hypothetical protein PSV13_10490 [Lacunisphaera sp.]|nr:hypothetical protein [Lacunisphaera sp.]
MPGQRKDYILDQIELLRQFVARLTIDRNPAGLEEALQLSLNLQAKLFPRPAPEFLALPVDAQIDALQAGATPAVGRDKCLTYARLLQQTASLYEFRGRPDLAAGARQLALHVALTLAVASPADDAATLVPGLLDDLDPLDLHPPVRALLDRFVAPPP